MYDTFTDTAVIFLFLLIFQSHSSFWKVIRRVFLPPHLRNNFSPPYNHRQSMASPVLDAQSVAHLQALHDHVASATEANLFRRNSVPVTLAVAPRLALEKTGLTHTTFFTGIGYNVSVPNVARGGSHTFALWVQDPLDDVEGNRAAVLKGIENIMHNPNTGKMSFDVSARLFA